MDSTVSRRDIIYVGAPTLLTGLAGCMGETTNCPTGQSHTRSPETSSEDNADLMIFNETSKQILVTVNICHFSDQFGLSPKGEEGRSKKYVNPVNSSGEFKLVIDVKNGPKVEGSFNGDSPSVTNHSGVLAQIYSHRIELHYYE